MGNLLTYLQGKLISILYISLALIISLPAHEIAHAYTAYKLGDPTAKNLGRLSLNPLKHLDPIGTICLLLFQFGWAKPVPIDPRNFKNRKGGIAVTALSGPLANLILAFIAIVLQYILAIFSFNINQAVLYTVLRFLSYFSFINIGLCLFNLIPVPPLDGSNILIFFLPDSVGEFFNRYGMYFQIILLFLLFTPIITNPLTTLVNNVYNNLSSIAGLIFRTFIGS
ncbi:peptidase M50 [[Clostridium] cellulosi]|jgi:Peptidase family M50.|uniref:Peptidase M50 n=1 Tax=[Clostridium] cellulosi TaxID=29343 RepID=A0A078KNQ2_9FIRM|nr:MAG: site-2 protease family protein [[Clostridium] cellulosi]CDZ24113.1 peptidase M50 [[Clostridium] cellulosi]